MAFGLKHIQGAEDDKARALKKDLQDQSDDSPDTPSHSSAPTQTAPRFARRPAAPVSSSVQTSKEPETGSQTERAVARVAANTTIKETTNSFMKAKAIFEGDGDVTPEMYNELPSSEFDEDEQEEIVAVEEENYGPTQQQKLSLRARRLAQEVGEFKKWSLDTIVALERRAQREPEVVIDELLPVYRNEVQPSRQMGFRTLDDAIKKHSDETVFLLVKGDKDRVRIVAKGTGQDVLNGAVLESLQSNSTPFDKPKYVFPKLFEKSEEQPAPAPKSPAP